MFFKKVTLMSYSVCQMQPLTDTGLAFNLKLKTQYLNGLITSVSTVMVQSGYQIEATKRHWDNLIKNKSPVK